MCRTRGRIKDQQQNKQLTRRQEARRKIEERNELKELGLIDGKQ